MTTIEFLQKVSVQQYHQPELSFGRAVHRVAALYFPETLTAWENAVIKNEVPGGNTDWIGENFETFMDFFPLERV